MSERRNQSFTPPIVHRDIKPSNIILTEDGRIVLIDLNAARLDDKNRSHDTQLIGTAGFAAPEQYGFAASSPPCGSLRGRHPDACAVNRNGCK